MDENKKLDDEQSASLSDAAAEESTAKEEAPDTVISTEAENNTDESDALDSVNDDNSIEQDIPASDSQEDSDASESAEEPANIQDGGELTDDCQPSDETMAAEYKPKKKKYIYVPVIIAAVILCVSLLAYGGCKLIFDVNVEGGWVYSEYAESAENEDEVLPYLIFEKDGTARYSVGNMYYFGTYSVTQSEGQKTLSATIPYALSGEFQISLEGTNLADKTLNIYSNGSELKFLEVDMKEYTITPPENFTPIDEIVGEWYNETQGVTYTINADGTMSFKLQADDIGMAIDGSYTVADGVITFTYFSTEETSTEIPYTISESGNIVIAELEYKNLAEAE